MSRLTAPAHPSGDPIEDRVLTQAFRRGTDKGDSAPSDSVPKTNIGHLGAAAGVAETIKESVA
jgi:acyl transferase domain-containing protein